MARKPRKIIKIDEELCDGCGLCVPACAEGALQIVNGKAKLVADKYCDGLGACLGECPKGAISFETRDADDFDEEAAAEHAGHLRQSGTQQTRTHASPARPAMCPSARTIDRTQTDEPAGTDNTPGQVPSELRQWPVKLYLVSPNAPFFENAHLLIAADCVPFAFGAFHPQFLRGKVLVTGCPKFDEVQLYADKLEEILRSNNILSVSVIRMEVPCCSGLEALAGHALEASGKDIPFETIVVGLDGTLKDESD